MTYLLRVNLDIEENRPGKSLRFRKAVQTIKAFNKNGAKVVIMAHLGRPDGYDKKFSLKKEFLNHCVSHSKIILFASHVQKVLQFFLRILF